MRRTPSTQHRAGLVDDVLARPRCRSTGWSRPTWASQARACSSVRRRRSASSVDEQLQAAGAGAREEAGRALGDGEVRQAADGEVQHVLGGLGLLAGERGKLRRGERADHGEGGEVDALGAQPGAADGEREALDHVAAGRDDDDALARALGRVDDADRVEVEDGGVDRHRQVLLGVEAHGGRELARGRPAAAAR